jgi:hypothetical protein
MNKRSISPYLVSGVLASLACVPLTGCNRNNSADANAGITPTPTTSAVVTPVPTSMPTPVPTAATTPTPTPAQ